MIKKQTILSLAAACAVAVAATSCGGNKEAEVLQQQAARVNAELAEDVKEAPSLLADASAVYADSAFTVNVVFADSVMHVSDFSQALIEYFLSDEIKKRPLYKHSFMLEFLSSWNM